MDREQYLLCKLAEECSEVIKECMKAQLYGLDSEWHGETNRERLAAELKQVMTTAELLFEDDPLEIHPSLLEWQKRVHKMKKYLEYSKECGKVDKGVEI